MGKLFHRRAFWLVIGLLVVAGAGGVVVYRSMAAAPETTAQAAVQTATVRQGDLVLYASGSGTLVAAESVDAGFRTSGELVELLVNVGDTVESGQLLGRVDDTSAQAQLQQAQMALRELTSPAALATARQAVGLAQDTLTDSRNQLAWMISPSVLIWEERLAGAQHAAVEAEAAAAAARSAEATAALEAAQSELHRAERNLAYAQSIYGDYLVETFTTVEQHGPTTEESYDPPTGGEIETARGDYELATAELAEAQWLLAALTGEELPAEAYGSGLTQLQEARLSLDSAQRSVDGTSLYAPISGTVTAVNANLGETVGSGAVISLADLTRPMLDVNLDETDLDKVHVGDEAEIVFDALPDSTFAGHVTEVDPSLQSAGMMATVHAVVQMDEQSLTGSPRLLLGMNAAVDIISGRATAALLVPVEALREVSPGQYAVFVVENGEPRLRSVEVGLMDVTYAEITSGLSAGEVVTTGLVETE